MRGHRTASPVEERQVETFREATSVRGCRYIIKEVDLGYRVGVGFGVCRRIDGARSKFT